MRCTPFVLALSLLAVAACRSSSPNDQSEVSSQQALGLAPEGSAPAGTRVMVRTVDLIDSRRQGTGARFTAKLEADLFANDGTVIARAGNTVYGQIAQAKQAGRLMGKSEMTIILTDINIDNRIIPMQTSAVKAVTQSSTGNTVGRTATGAAIGGIASGSKGAKRGAAIGLGTAALTKGAQISIPPGTLLDFTLANHLVVNTPAPAEKKGGEGGEGKDG